jgi:hypothetical protein
MNISVSHNRGSTQCVCVPVCVCLRCGLACQRAGPQLPSGREWRRELQLAHPPTVRAKCTAERPSFLQSLIRHLASVSLRRHQVPVRQTSKGSESFRLFALRSPPRPRALPSSPSSSTTLRLPTSCTRTRQRYHDRPPPRRLTPRGHLAARDLNPFVAPEHHHAHLRTRAWPQHADQEPRTPRARRG